MFRYSGIWEAIPNIDGEGEKGYCSTATGLEKRGENMSKQKQRGERSNEVLKRGIFTA